jgi:hypothetical protein
VIPSIAGLSTPWARQIAPIQWWNGRVYVAYGDYTANDPDGCDLVYWDEAAGAYGSLGIFANAHAMGKFTPVGTDLWLTPADTAGGSSPDAAVIGPSHAYSVVADGKVVPWHLFDAAQFANAQFLCGANLDVNNTSVSWGAVWRRTSAGWTRPLILGTSSAEYRIYGLFVLNGTLYAAPIGTNLYATTDGVQWAITPTNLGTQAGHFWPVSGGVLYRNSYDRLPGQSTALKKWTGSAISVVSSGSIAHTLASDGIPWMLRVVNTVPEVAVGSADGMTWTRVDNVLPALPSSIAVSPTHIYLGTENSHIWRRAR